MSVNKSQTALQHYLDGLLQEADIEQFNEPPMLLEEKPAIPVILPTLTPTKVEAQPEPERVEVTQSAVPEPEKQPAWAEGPFECLLFDVAGLTLAVPLISLGSIYPLEIDDVTPIFAQPEWFVGIMPTPIGNIKVLDTARWVMPERYNETLRDHFKFVISIDGFDWGLAVNQVRNAIRLSPEDVKWRTQRTQRAWLAGTVIEHMCALLDVKMLAHMVTNKDRPDEADTRISG